MNVNDPQFWMMISSIIVAICFIIMAAGLVWIAVTVRRVVATVRRVEQRVDPLIVKVNAMGTQGKEISVHLTEVSGNLSTATKYLAESTELIKDQVAELKTLVGETAYTAKDKVALVSRTIDRTQMQVIDTTDFVQAKIVEPAREIAAVLAGVRKGLEVLFAPPPKQIDTVYQDDEMFIG